jgi:hypothetical protein
VDLAIEGEELVARDEEDAGFLGAAELGEIEGVTIFYLVGGTRFDRSRVYVHLVHMLVMDEPQAALVVECQLV